MPTSMELEGIIRNRKTRMLIATGSRLNFLSERLVDELGLERVPVEKFSVTLANDAEMEVAYICRRVPWHVQGVDFETDFYVIGMHDREAILGIQWVATLGVIQWNFRSRTMEFQHGDQKVILRSAVTKPLNSCMLIV